MRWFEPTGASAWQRRFTCSTVALCLFAWAKRALFDPLEVVGDAWIRRHSGEAISLACTGLVRIVFLGSKCKTQAFVFCIGSASSSVCARGDVPLPWCAQVPSYQPSRTSFTVLPALPSTVLAFACVADHKARLQAASLSSQRPLDGRLTPMPEPEGEGERSAEGEGEGSRGWF